MQNTLARYFVAVLASSVAMAINAAIWPTLNSRFPLIAFFPAIAVSSWFGGFGPGLLATVISGTTATYLWSASRSFHSLAEPEIVVMALFVTMNVTIAALFETLRRRTRRAEQLADALRISQAQLLEVEHAARQRAEHANRLKDELLATTSHEMRTPLGAILGWAEILKHGPIDDERREHALHAIYRNAQEQTRLLGELLDMVRIGSASLRLNYAEVDLRSVVHTAWDSVEPAAAAKGVTSRIEIEPSGANHSFQADDARLRQIVMNLLSNAVKFTPSGGEIRVQVLWRKSAVEIVVSDTGCGISPTFLPFIFEPFRQADASATGPNSGFGLGLAIVKRLVEAHGGEVYATSEGAGRGATFVVGLPVTAPRISEHCTDSLARA